MDPARKAGAQVSLYGALGCTASDGRRQALEAAVKADLGHRVTVTRIGGRPEHDKRGRHYGVCYLWDRATLGMAGTVKCVLTREHPQQRFSTANVQAGLATCPHEATCPSARPREPCPSSASRQHRQRRRIRS